ncbi:hypothetical protein Tco_0896140, partial [Tanacetum coccineum]
GKLRDRNAKESWALLEDLALYDNESWNDPRDFAKLVKAIALPQDVPSTSDRRLIELENKVQRLMEAHLALTQPTQVKKNHYLMSSERNNIKLAIRNEKSEVVCATCKQRLITANHDECVFKYVNGMNPSKKNQSANVSKSANQKKRKAIVKKSKKLGSKERLASPWPRKPRTCLRWLPTRRIFDLCGKINTSSNTESESDTSVCDNASDSNPLGTYKQRVSKFYFFSWQVYETLEVDYMYTSAGCSLSCPGIAYVHFSA